VKFSVVLILLILCALTGCATAERQIAENVRTETPWGAVDLFDQQGRVMTPREQSSIGRTDLNILALSGGGADGAFGAGLLNGWTQRGNRPTFDIVTGVSTGALMASLAFLGPRYDGALTDLAPVALKRSPAASAIRPASGYASVKLKLASVVGV
jgi:hypothetical protein